MHILVCGKPGSGKTEITNQLRQHFTFRGHACYALDYMAPIYQVYHAVYLVAKQYDIDQPVLDQDLISHIMRWGDSNLQGWSWSQCVKNQMSKITQRWEELKMFYVGIIKGVPYPQDLSLFPGSFKVYLDCSQEVRKERLKAINKPFAGDGHPTEIGFNDCAVCDIFNLVVDTKNKTPSEVTEIITHSFHDKLHAGFKEDKDT